MKHLSFALLLLMPFKALANEAATPNQPDQVRQALINACLDELGQNPFDPATVKPKLLAPTVSVGNHGTVLTDDEKTSTPTLVIVAPAVNVMSDVTYQFLNPNGWYCLATNLSILGNTKVKVDCGAHFAQLNVSVFSQADVQRIGNCTPDNPRI